MHSYFAFHGLRLELFGSHHPETSQVLHSSPKQILATSTPDPTQPVNRFPLSLSQEYGKPLVWESSNFLSTLTRWFTSVQLSVPYLTGSSGLLTESFTTVWSPIQQHSAVCDPLLQADHGGPTTISSTASSCEVLGTLPYESPDKGHAFSTPDTA